MSKSTKKSKKTLVKTKAKKKNVKNISIKKKSVKISSKSTKKKKLKKKKSNTGTTKNITSKKAPMVRTGMLGFTFNTKWEELRRKGVDISNEYIELVKEKKRKGIRINQLNLLEEIENKFCR